MNLNLLNYVAVEDQIKAVGDALKARIVASGIKKIDIAKRADISLNTINNCISGRNTNLKSLLSILYVLGIDLISFMKTVSETDSMKLISVPKPEQSADALNAEAIKKEIKETSQSPDQLAMRSGIPADDIKAVASISDAE